MSDNKLLTENGWKAMLVKFKLKDNGLQRALGAYEKLPDDKLAERLKSIGEVKLCAANFRKAREVSSLPDVIDYLTDLAKAADSEQREILKAKVLAEKSAKVDAAAQKKAEEQEEEEGEYATRLMAALHKLKSSRDLSYPFIACEGKPAWGLMVAKQITPRHKAELTKLITGASKRFFPGSCKFENGKFAFTLEKPPAGMARKLQDSIKCFTGQRLPVLVGTEAADADDE